MVKPTKYTINEIYFISTYENDCPGVGDMPADKPAYHIRPRACFLYLLPELVNIFDTIPNRK